MSPKTTNAELAVLGVLRASHSLAWHVVARSTALDDDALSDTVELLLARGAVRIVRSWRG
jgi:hypothetical protein